MALLRARDLLSSQLGLVEVMWRDLMEECRKAK